MNKTIYWKIAPLAVLLAGCMIGPDYERPEAPVPQVYKEDGWKTAQPDDARDRGAWWAVYNDAVLDQLESQVEISNQTLKGAEAAYAQAAAVARAAHAGLFPTASLAPSFTRGSTKAGTKAAVANSYDLSTSASWDLDVWGKIRRTVESDVATAQASAGDLASAKLLAQSQLATDYFELRIEDELKALLTEAVGAYGKSLKITQNQYRAGVASKADVAQAETQLKATQASLINVDVLRAQLEHAIAVLIGKPPAEFSITPLQLNATVPVAPTDVPSTLLERRPDIAAAERRVAAANANIGAAMAAFYPDISLSAAFGYANASGAGLFQAANRVWSFGPQMSQILFDGGLRSAQTDEARAEWDQSVATYRQTVLTAFQQVEDNLVALSVLQRQSAVQADAVTSARQAERLILNQYKAGTVAYTSVVTAQTAALTDEEGQLTILENQLVASVALIQALGGGWSVAQLPADPLH